MLRKSAVFVTVVVAAWALAPFTAGQTSRPTAGQMQQGRFFHAAARLADDRVLLSHGLRNGLLYNESCELFDPATEQFSTTPCSAAHRRQHRSARLPDGRVLDLGFEQSATSPGEMIDVAGAGAGNATLAIDATSMRTGHTITPLLDGRLLVAGGRDDVGGPYVTQAELFDPGSGAFVAVGETGSFFGHDAVRLMDGRVLIAGGLPSLVDAVLFDPRTDSFSATGSLVLGREDLRMSLLPDGTVLASGGSDGTSRLTAELFDPETGQFTLIPSTMSSRREDHVSVLLHDGRLLVGGGENNTGGGDVLLATADLYDPPSMTFTPIADFQETRDDSSATLLAHGEVLLAGGEGALALGQKSAELWSSCTGAAPPAGPVGATLRLAKQGDRVLLDWQPASDAGSYLVRRGYRATALEPEPWRIALATDSWMARDDGADAYVRIIAANVCGVPAE